MLKKMLSSLAAVLTSFACFNAEQLHMTMEPRGDFFFFFFKKSSYLEHLDILEVTAISETLWNEDGICWFELNTVFYLAKKYINRTLVIKKS